MSYPQFIAIDGSSFEDYAHPVAIAWSLPNGQIKTTLVAPEDDWDDWDISLQDLHGINPDTLHQRGETAWSVIRELEHDLDNPYIFADHNERVENLLNKLYEACERELNFEIVNCREEIDPNSLDDYAHFQISCDERVETMLKTWAREQGKLD